MNNKKFHLNKKYFTISAYALVLIFLSTILVKCIMDWSATKATISQILKMLAPFTSGIIIAYLLYPLVAWFDRKMEKYLHLKKKKLRYGLSIFLSYAVILGLILFVLIIVIPQLISSLSTLITQVPAWYEEVLALFHTLEKKYPDINFSYVNNLIETIAPQFMDLLKNLATNILPVIYNTGVSIVKGIINVFVAIIISCYLLIDKDRLFKSFNRIFNVFISSEKLEAGKIHLDKCNKIFSGFVIGKTIDSLIIGIICYIVMRILQLDYALLISVLIGITNVIPYFGPFIGAIPSAFILLLISPIQCLVFSIWILILQQIDGNLIGPKILGESTGVRPLWIIFAITIGGSLAGVLGMFFGVPILAIIFYLGDIWLKQKESQKIHTEESPNNNINKKDSPT